MLKVYLYERISCFLQKKYSNNTEICPLPQFCMSSSISWNINQLKRGDGTLRGAWSGLFLRAAAYEVGGGLVMIIWLVIGFFVCQRLIEMLVAKRNEKKVKALGAIEFGASHYPYMVAMHTAFFSHL